MERVPGTAIRDGWNEGSLRPSVAAAPSLSAFLPVYNERANLERMVDKAHAVLGRLTADYEVLIIDDGSTDGSERIADELAAQNSRVRAIHHPGNRGYGCALRTGFGSACKELVFYTDCDEPVDLNEIARALEFMQPHVDLVIGYRIDRYDTPRRRLYSRACNLLVRQMLGVRVRDVNFSFKLVRRRVLERIRLGADSTFIDGELLAEAVRYGFHVVEIPVQYFPRTSGASSFDDLRAPLHAGCELFAYWWRTRVRRCP
jgi:glycosyltransferase involved in cell wall biosynthesis